MKKILTTSSVRLKDILRPVRIYAQYLQFVAYFNLVAHRQEQLGFTVNHYAVLPVISAAVTLL